MFWLMFLFLSFTRSVCTIHIFLDIWFSEMFGLWVVHSTDWDILTRSSSTCRHQLHWRLYLFWMSSHFGKFEFEHNVARADWKYISPASDGQLSSLEAIFQNLVVHLAGKIFYLEWISKCWLETRNVGKKKSKFVAEEKKDRKIMWKKPCHCFALKASIFNCFFFR